MAPRLIVVQGCAVRTVVYNLVERLQLPFSGDTISDTPAAADGGMSGALRRAALPALALLLDMPEWGALIRYVGGRNSAPGVHLQSVLQHAYAGPRDPQTFLHADTFHPTVKAWFYLTDVAEDAGPLIYDPFLPWTSLDSLLNMAGRRKMDWRRREGSLFDTADGA